MRGLAVLVVVLYHTGVLTGGWIGVEVFFVLSGYLITSLLVRELDSTGRVDLVGFWRRRARRLLPALFLLLACVAIYVVVVAEPTSYTSIRRDVWGVLTYSSNWISIYGGGGYWQQFDAPSPLHHMWSLAIEEQFYVLYPVVAVVVLRRRVRSWALPLLTAAALAWQLWMTFHVGIDRFYLGTDTRAFGILLGACVALVGAGWWVRLAQVMAFPALLVLGFAVWRFDGASRATFHGGFQLVTVAAAVVVLGVSLVGEGVVSRLVSWRWLTRLGTWSYGIYLVHWPLAEGLRQRYELGRWAVTLIVLPVSVALAAASFRWVETRLRRQGLASFGRKWLPLLVAAACSVAALSVTTVGAEKPISASDVAAQDAPAVDPEGRPIPTLAPGAVVGITPRPADRPYRVMLVGDSVAESLNWPLLTNSEALGIELFSRAAPSCSYDRERTNGGDGFVEDASCVTIVENWAQDVADYRPDVVLFLYGSWTQWVYDGELRSQCEDILADRVHELYALALQDLAAYGAPVYFLGAPYWRADGGSAALDETYDCMRDVLRTFVDQNRRQAAFIDLHPLVCDGNACDATAGGEPVRPDGLHFSGAGSIAVTVAALSQAIEPPPGGWPPTAAIECCKP